MIAERARFIVWADRLSAAQDDQDSNTVDTLARTLWKAHPGLIRRVLAWVGQRACTRILDGL